MATSDMKHLLSRHIQNFSDAQSLEPHWGYADRVLPCTNDAGSCEYLDEVYGAHDRGMLYVGILWATIGGILLIWAIGRRISLSSQSSNDFLFDKSTDRAHRSASSTRRLQQSLSSFSRKLLLPEFAKPIFGRTTRLQVLVLAILVGYLTIWSFVGIAYKKWITPVKNNPGLYNTRTGLGPFSDRVGVLAYALIPLSVLLSSRESLLSLLTGTPYQRFNFLHRWLGYIILVQSIIHTVGWSIIEIRLYQPQPKTARDWIVQRYMIWGVVAQIFILLMFIFSLRPVIRLTGYEFFRKVHYVIAMLFIGACWAHWEPLKCFLLPSLLLWGVDRGIRFIRTWLIHYNHVSETRMKLTAGQAVFSLFPDQLNGDVIRLDFNYPSQAWSVGQHFYLCFPEMSIWQSHPFTPCTLPRSWQSQQTHSYIIRAKGGETKKLAALAATKIHQDMAASTPVILTGPYGEETVAGLSRDTNILCIAGGTGITYVLPVLLHLAALPANADRKIELIWAIRLEHNIEWIRSELDILEKVVQTHNMTIRIFVTRECCKPIETIEKEVMTKPDMIEASSSSATSSQDEIKEQKTAAKGVLVDEVGHGSVSFSAAAQRPGLDVKIADFVRDTIRGPTNVYASGPGGMISDIRKAIAACNDADKVWKGDERFDVRLICDDRLEW